MATAQAVIAAREGGDAHPDLSTVRLVTIEIASPNMPEPLYIVQNSTVNFVAEGKTYIPYYFEEEIPDIKPNVRPEMTISFLQVAEEQSEALFATASIHPPPTVKRATWEVKQDGTTTKSSELLYPMPVRNVQEGDSGTIEVICADEDLDNIPFNPVTYNTDDHPRMKAVF